MMDAGLSSFPPPRHVRSGFVRGLTATAAVTVVAASALGVLLGSCRSTPPLESGASYAAEETAIPASAAAQSAPGVVASGAPQPPLMADVAPISALAFDGRFLWIGSARGLRRVEVATRAGTWVGHDSGFDDHDVTALAFDDATGTVWVGTSKAVGVFEPGPGAARYQQLALVRGLTHILPVFATPERTDAWLGTEDGLLRLDAGLTTPVPGAGGDVITSLDDDAEGRAVWVGFRQRGLLRVNPDHSGALTAAAFSPATAVGPGYPGGLDFVNPIGTTLLPSGTRVAVGFARRDGGTRLALLGAAGAVLMAPQSAAPHVQAVTVGCAPRITASAAGAGTGVGGGIGSIARRGCTTLANLVAGPDAAPMLYRLALATRGENLGPGSIRFVPIRRTLEGPRLVAVPIGRLNVEAVTAVTAARLAPESEDQDLFVGTRASGAARISAAGVTAVLPSGEVALGASRLSVACPTAERCYVATGAGPGWALAEGGRSLEALPGTTAGGRLMALATAPDGSTLSVAGDPGKLLRIARVSSDGTRFDPVAQVPVPVSGTGVVAIATSATVSPKGDLWVALRERLPARLPDPPGAASARAPGPSRPGPKPTPAVAATTTTTTTTTEADGAADADRDVPRGVLEIQFPSLRVVHHRAYSAAEKAPAEVIPIDADVRAIRFQARTETAPQAIWFCTAHGVFRFREGTLERWGEDNGLASERCGDLIVEPDGSVWAATSAGPGRFDGKDWHGVERWPTDRDGEGRAARGLVAVGPQLWFGSPAGLWSMTTPARGGRVAGFRHDDRLLDDDVTGVVVDRFARLWVLGRSGVTRLEPEGLPSPRN
jgi:hypothetical protein